MQKFNICSGCAKCGNQQSSIEYVATDPKVIEQVAAPLREALGVIPMPDTIKRKCHRCGFVWFEFPLDRKD